MTFVLCIIMFPWFVAFRPLMQVLPALVIDWNMAMKSADKAIIQKTDTIMTGFWKITHMGANDTVNI